jgi:hypothetical protein
MRILFSNETRGKLRGARNFLFYLARCLLTRIACGIFGHVGAFDGGADSLRFYSALRKKMRGVNACKRCGSIYAIDVEQEGATKMLWRDLF